MLTKIECQPTRGMNEGGPIDEILLLSLLIFDRPFLDLSKGWERPKQSHSLIDVLLS